MCVLGVGGVERDEPFLSLTPHLYCVNVVYVYVCVVERERIRESDGKRE